MTQSKALEILQSGKNVFLTGEPGSGKTHTVNLFTKWLKERYRSYAVTASTGIAATHINGTTIHSWTGIGIKEDITPEYLDMMAEKPFLIKAIRHTDVLIIDEISMLSAKMVDNVDKVCRFIRGDERPFGGLQVVFVGDFFQLPPVSKTKAAFAFEAKSWEAADLSICYLTEQHRQDDAEFLDILRAMRDGKITKAQKLRLLDHEGDAKPETILYTHNAEVDSLNRAKLDKIDGALSSYEMQSSGIPFLVDKLKASCLSPEKLHLKIGAIVMFTKNNFEEGYVNGTLGTVVEYQSSTNMPVVRTKDGRRIVARYAEWSIDDTRAVISQVPLRLAWAITVHKSQGMSLDAARIDLSKSFEYGQGYVAISRVRSLKGLYLEGANDHAFLMHPTVVKHDIIFRKKSDEQV